MKKIVTVDGPAGSGKSTIAKLLANRIGFQYLDTGSIYRALALFFVQEKIQNRDISRINESIPNIKVKIENDKVFLNGEDVNEKIRNKEIEKQVPLFAQVTEVREHVRTLQKKIAEDENFIVDGRDIGSVVFTDAFCKFYLDADANTRAKRRFQDTKSKEDDRTLEEVEKEMKERDTADKTRAESPLKIPVDALLIDSSNLSIDTVIDKMIEYYNKRLSEISDTATTSNTSDSNIFLNALESFEDKRFEPGTLIKGRIINIKKTEILLDVGSKRDGVIDSEEIKKLDMSELKINDEVDVFVIRDDISNSQVKVSKHEADKRSALIELKEKFDAQELVEGSILQSIKGGFIVDIKGNSAFCPYSEFDLRKVNKVKQIGEAFDFYIVELNKDKIILSRKKHLEEKYEKLRGEFFETTQEGDIVEATVVNIEEFGVFMELSEGVTAIMRPKNISWSRFNDLKEVIEKGEVFKVKILSIRQDKNKIEVSKKDAESDPIIDFSLNHKAGDTLKGTVMNIESFGAFIEVHKGVEGLCHVSEMSWTKRINDPNEILKVGDQVEAKLLSISIEDRKVSLGLKQVMDNPWETIEQRLPLDEITQATVLGITKQGVTCLIREEFDGFIHLKDISWSTDKVNLKNMFKEGERIDVKVIGYNKARRRIDLGVKQKTANPWQDLMANHGVGSAITGEVVRIISSGAFVKLSEELEGFCHVSQLSTKKIEKVEDEVEVGKSYVFCLQVIDERNKKIALSIKEHLRNEEKKDIERYLNNSETTNTISLGDLINK